MPNGPLTMQIPIALKSTHDLTGENHFEPSQPERPLSFESQLKLRLLYEYIDNSKATLDEIQRILSVGVSGLYDPPLWKKAAEKFAVFCFEADSWGFDDIFDVAQGLKMLLSNSIGRTRTDGVLEALTRGLAMLSALLSQCESDFRWRLATADTLDCINQAGESVV
jgi:hypothetical protein